MDILPVAISCFFAAFFLHIVCHRILWSFGKKSVLVLGSYLIGWIIVTLYSLSRLEENIPPFLVTVWVLFGTSSLLISIIYFPLLLEGKTPSTEILGMFQKNAQYKKNEIYRRFTNESLIDIRIKTLVRQGFIEEKNNRFMLTAKGMVVKRLVFFYSWVFGTEVAG